MCEYVLTHKILEKKGFIFILMILYGNYVDVNVYLSVKGLQ